MCGVQYRAESLHKPWAKKCTAKGVIYDHFHSTSSSPTEHPNHEDAKGIGHLKDVPPSAFLWSVVTAPSLTQLETECCSNSGANELQYIRTLWRSPKTWSTARQLPQLPQILNPTSTPAGFWWVWRNWSPDMLLTAFDINQHKSSIAIHNHPNGHGNGHRKPLLGRLCRLLALTCCMYLRIRYNRRN